MVLVSGDRRVVRLKTFANIFVTTLSLSLVNEGTLTGMWGVADPSEGAVFLLNPPLGGLYSAYKSRFSPKFTLLKHSHRGKERDEERERSKASA